MPIVGFNFTKLSVEKKNLIKQTVNVKNNTLITKIEEEKLPITDSKNEVLKIHFEFTTKYEPDIGEANLHGNLLFLDETKKIKEILKQWKKNKKLPQDMMSNILNTILIKCNIKTLLLSEEVNLPPQIPLPKLAPKKKEDYIG